MGGLNPINTVISAYQQLGVNNLQRLEIGKIQENIASEQINKIGSSSAPEVARRDTKSSFERLLTDFVNQVNEKQQVADSTVKDLLSGKEVSLHQAVIAMEEANVAFSLMVEVRNKLIEAYQELMRMQI